MLTVEKKKQIINIIQNFILVILGVMLLSCFITFFTNGKSFARSNVFGYRLSFVMSESMEPTIMTHALCLTDMIHKDYKVGDVVVYEHVSSDKPKMLIVHRVIDITDEGNVITKGDNNETADPWETPMSSVIGKITHTWNGFAKIYD